MASALPPLVALEIGTTRTRVLVGEVREDGHLMVTGIGEQPSRGIRKGELIHFENALSCVKRSLDEADAQSQVSIHEVYLLISGGGIRALSNRGSVPIQGPDREITREHMQHVMDAARAMNLPEDREVIHSLEQQYYVDDQPGVVHPEGMEGASLSLDMLILHGVRNRIRNTIRVAKSAPVEVSGIAFGGLCAALAVLTPEQKEAGVVVIDVGGGTTDYVAYAGQVPVAAGSIAVGGDHITNDLAVGLYLPTAQAEKLKREHGSAMVDLAHRSQTIPMPAEGGFVGCTVKQNDVENIIHARVEEIFYMIYKHLSERNLLPVLGGGVILTGGSTYLKRMPELCEKVLGLRCGQGKPRNVSGLATVTEGAEYAAPVGLLRYAMQEGRHPARGPFGGLFRGWFRRG